jgi:aspartyl-tRNA(Asn)/glutamyl-tRNA(Gln) amidotransferase subunit C
MSVSPEDVRHVARLARVGLDEAHIPTLVRELNGILEHMEVLQRVELAPRPSNADIEATPLRDDAAPADALQRPREAFAPAMRDGFFLVPRLVTHGAQGATADDDEGAA